MIIQISKILEYHIQRYPYVSVNIQLIIDEIFLLHMPFFGIIKHYPRFTVIVKKNRYTSTHNYYISLQLTLVKKQKISI